MRKHGYYQFFIHILRQLKTLILIDWKNSTAFVSYMLVIPIVLAFLTRSSFCISKMNFCLYYCQWDALIETLLRENIALFLGTENFKISSNIKNIRILLPPMSTKCNALFFVIFNFFECYLLLSNMLHHIL